MHLQSVVSRSVRQTPQYGNITDFDLSRGDFVFLASLTKATGSGQVEDQAMFGIQTCPGSSQYTARLNYVLLTIS
jgi:hypothetical protein